MEDTENLVPSVFVVLSQTFRTQLRQVGFKPLLHAQKRPLLCLYVFTLIIIYIVCVILADVTITTGVFSAVNHTIPMACASNSFIWTIKNNTAVSLQGTGGAKLYRDNYSSDTLFMLACKRNCAIDAKCKGFVIDGGVCKPKASAIGYKKAGKSFVVKGECITTSSCVPSQPYADGVDKAIKYCAQFGEEACNPILRAGVCQWAGGGAGPVLANQHLVDVGSDANLRGLFEVLKNGDIDYKWRIVAKLTKHNLTLDDTPYYSGSDSCYDGCNYTPHCGGYSHYSAVQAFINTCGSPAAKSVKPEDLLIYGKWVTSYNLVDVGSDANITDLFELLKNGDNKDTIVAELTKHKLTLDDTPYYSGSDSCYARCNHYPSCGGFRYYSTVQAFINTCGSPAAKSVKSEDLTSAGDIIVVNGRRRQLRT